MMILDTHTPYANQRHTDTDPAELCKCVAWVEDRKIRLYDIEERGPLRTPSPAWEAALRQVGGVDG